VSVDSVFTFFTFAPGARQIGAPPTTTYHGGNHEHFTSFTCSTTILAGTIASAAVVPISFAQESEQPSGGSHVSKHAAQYQNQPNGQQRCKFSGAVRLPRRQRDRDTRRPV
jgi:hypothetical protein